MRKRQRALGPYPHRRSWHVVYVEADGTRTRCSYESEEQARAEAEGFNELHSESLSLSDALDKYERHYLVGRGNKPGSWTETRRRIVRFVGDLEQELDAFTPRRAAARYEQLVDEMAADSHRGCLTHTKTFFGWCVGKDWIAENPLAGIEPQGKKKKGKEKLRRDEARTWLHTALEMAERGQWRALMASIALMFNLRASEVLGLRVRDVDDDGRLLVVEGTKTEAARRPLKIPAEMRPYLLAQRGLLPAGRDGSELLFGDHDRRFVNFWVGKVCAAAGVKRITAHGMRGTHSELALEEGTSPEALARSMGHETFQVTSEHYVSAETRAAATQRRAFEVLEGGKGR